MNGGRAISGSRIVEIVEADAEGRGLGTLDGRQVSIAGVIPGERVEVAVREGSRGRPHDELIRVLRASPHRVVPLCRHADVCGGCAWQHVAYAEQLRLKQRALQQLLEVALGNRAPRVDPTIGAPAPDDGDAAPSGLDPQAPWRFRHKVSFTFGPGARGRPLLMGHYRRGSNSLVPIEECPVHAEAGNLLAFRMRDALAAAGVPGAAGDGRTGIARHLVIRVARNRRELMATLVVTANDRSLRGALRWISAGSAAPDSLHLNIHQRPGPYLFGKETRRLYGRDRLREEVGGVTFLLSPATFFQTNVNAAATLLGLVVEALSGQLPGRVLDLYAGVGLFALPLARLGHIVTAVEESAEAVEDGTASQRFSRIPADACRFVRARVEDVVAKGIGGAAAGTPPDAVVLDPPRTGCPARVLDALVGEFRLRRLVYVSCNPAALAADLARAVAAGYRVDRVQPVDMFPHTAHIESVASLTRARHVL